MTESQEKLAIEFGLAYKALYFVEYKDPNYPCQDCKGVRIFDCECYNSSYKQVLTYDGVYAEPDRTVEEVAGRLTGPKSKSRPSRGNYLLFTDPDPLVQEFRTKYFELKSKPDHTMKDLDYLYSNGIKIKNGEKYVWFSQLSDYTITLHRRSWDKLPKDRHNPVDMPIDFSGIKV